MAAFYWRWRWPTGDPRAYLQFLDAECAGSWLNKLYRADNEAKCMFCQEQVNTELPLILWVTYFIPGQERVNYSFDFHPNCFAQNEHDFERNARRLPDNEGRGGGPPASTRWNPWASWEQQGIDRRVEAS